MFSKRLQDFMYTFTKLHDWRIASFYRQKSPNQPCQALKRMQYTDKLEYLAVYGRASMAAFRHLSTHIVPPRINVRQAQLNTYGQKFDPESFYEPIKFETLQPYLVNFQLTASNWPVASMTF